MSPTYRKTQRREALMKKYEALGYDAERSGDITGAQQYFQLAENYKRTKENEQ